MKNKVMWLFLTGLLVLPLISFPACFSKPSPPQATMTHQEVVILIAFKAVPSLDHYLEQAGQPATESQVQAVGDWNAVDDGGGNWTVEGQVMINYPDEIKYCSSTWTLKQSTGEIQLIQFKCD